jgi:hypothetical protein
MMATPPGQDRVGPRDDEFIAAVTGGDVMTFDVLLHRDGTRRSA